MILDSIEVPPNLQQAIEIFDEEDILTQDEYDRLTRKREIFRPGKVLNILIRSGCVKVIPPANGKPKRLEWTSGKQIRKLLIYIEAASSDLS